MMPKYSMAKALGLDASVLVNFCDVLKGSPGLGSHFRYRVADGQLWVWVPEALTSIDPRRLREDIFYPETFDVDPIRKDEIRSFLSSEPNGLVIADTFYEPSKSKPGHFVDLEWFSLCPTYDPSQIRVCVFVRGPQLSDASYDALMAAASPYPTTVVCTSLPVGSDLASGIHLDMHSQILENLLHRTQIVIVGVFDELSMMGWSKR
jgi:hypothetical protein